MESDRKAGLAPVSLLESVAMARLLLNRELSGGDVPAIPVAELEPPGGDLPGGHPYLWARVWQFARSFDAAAYARATGTRLDEQESLASARAAHGAGRLGGLHLRDLRSALCGIAAATGEGATASRADVLLIDALLDAIHADVSAGRRRPRSETEPYEPGLGHFGALHGEGQHRFWFVAREPLGRESLYDRAAGLLLREVAADVIVSALYLYPPQYPQDDLASPLHAFMLLLEPRGRGRLSRPLDDEYALLGRRVVAALADEQADHWPTA